MENQNPIMEFINKTMVTNEICQICKSKLEFIRFKRMHKCKRCLLKICAHCGIYKGKIYGNELYKLKKSNRICNICNIDY